MTHIIQVRFVSLMSGEAVEVETPDGKVYIGVYPEGTTVEFADGRTVDLRGTTDSAAAPGEGGK